MAAPPRARRVGASSLGLLLLLLLAGTGSHAFLLPSSASSSSVQASHRLGPLQPGRALSQARVAAPACLEGRLAATTASAETETVRKATAVASDGLVVLTREAGKNDKLRARLEKQQVNVLELPCITHCHAEGHDQLAQTLDTGDFDYVVITSPEAAHVFLEVAATCARYKPTNLVAIGEATGDLLRKAGGEIVYTPSKALAKVLVPELPPSAAKEAQGKPTRVLYPASKRAAKTLEDGLQGRGDGKLFEVVRLNTYDTVPAEWSEEETAQAKGCEVVTFASPSALKVWTSRLGMGYKVACIGETTATAAREAGWAEEDIYYPKESPGLDGWADAVMEALAAGKR